MLENLNLEKPLVVPVLTMVLVVTHTLVLPARHTEETSSTVAAELPTPSI